MFVTIALARIRPKRKNATTMSKRRAEAAQRIRDIADSVDQRARQPERTCQTLSIKELITKKLSK